jgi:hypothetical protein
VVATVRDPLRIRCQVLLVKEAPPGLADLPQHVPLSDRELLSGGGIVGEPTLQREEDRDTLGASARPAARSLDESNR